MLANQKEKDIYLSVIIPTYNSEMFIEKCLLSVINQNVPNMEIIVVNDGSTDKTVQIVSSIALRYKNILLVTIVNNGVSHARNMGLNMAKGTFVTFVDSDDYLETEVYSMMLAEMEKFHADIVEGACRKEKENGALVFNCTLRKQVINGRYNCSEHFLKQDNCYNYMCNKIYRKRLFHNKKFPKLYYSEDYYMNALLHKNTSCKVVLNKIVYHYVIHDQSACGKKIDIKRIDTIRAGVMTEKLFKNQHLKVYPCMYTCDYCVKIAKMIYMQKDNILFNRFIQLSKREYIRMLKMMSPRSLKNSKCYQNYWVYVLFVIFPKSIVRLLK